MRPPARFNDFLELTKPRVTSLVLVTTAVGFLLGSSGPLEWLLFLHAIIGTALVAGGTSAFNQYMERDADARMQRTRRRPLPSGRLGPAAAFLFALAISVAGLLQLAVAVNVLTAALVGLALLTYVFGYTPLKRVTPLCTLVGAFPGALPALAGYTAARGTVGAGGFLLFAILFVWQVPHSLAIAWMYREDYARGGFAILPVLDPDGTRTSRQILLHSALLVALSLLPAAMGVAGALYLAGALVLGAGFMAAAVPIASDRGVRSARRLLLGSVAYLPVLFGLLAFDRLPPSMR